VPACPAQDARQQRIITTTTEIQCHVCCGDVGAAYCWNALVETRTCCDLATSLTAARALGPISLIVLTIPEDHFNGLVNSSPLMLCDRDVTSTREDRTRGPCLSTTSMCSRQKQLAKRKPSALHVEMTVFYGRVRVHFHDTTTTRLPVTTWDNSTCLNACHAHCRLYRTSLTWTNREASAMHVNDTLENFQSLLRGKGNECTTATTTWPPATRVSSLSNNISVHREHRVPTKTAMERHPERICIHMFERGLQVGPAWKITKPAAYGRVARRVTLGRGEPLYLVGMAAFLHDEAASKRKVLTRKLRQHVVLVRR
jgi:hypothetical protein